MRLAKAAQRLHHLSMRYAGALVELLQGKPTFGMPQGHPGLREPRDFIDLILFTRAEINGLTAVLHETGVLVEVGAQDVVGAAIRPMTMERYTEIMAEQYEWLTKEKAKFLAVGVSDEGLVFQGSERN